jgi:hypothetical protein
MRRRSPISKPASEINAATDAFRLRMEAGEDLTDEETDEIEANADELEKLTRRSRR